MPKTPSEKHGLRIKIATANVQSSTIYFFDFSIPNFKRLSPSLLTLISSLLRGQFSLFLLMTLHFLIYLMDICVFWVIDKISLILLLWVFFFFQRYKLLGSKDLELSVQSLILFRLANQKQKHVQNRCQTLLKVIQVKSQEHSSCRKKN